IRKAHGDSRKQFRCQQKLIHKSCAYHSWLGLMGLKRTATTGGTCSMEPPAGPRVLHRKGVTNGQESKTTRALSRRNQPAERGATQQAGRPEMGCPGLASEAGQRGVARLIGTRGRRSWLRT